MLHRMDRWSSRGRALEDLESSGTKIMMSGPIVYTLVMRMKQETQVVVLCYLLITIAKNSRRGFGVFLELIHAETTLPM